MNEVLSFGSYLNELLTLKGIDKKHFAFIMNINRSQLYRFLSSEQLPDLKQLNEISEKLNLRVSEQKKLLESYECTQYGWEIVKGRKLITEMLINLDRKTYLNDKIYKYTIDKPINENISVMPIRTKSNVISTLLFLLKSVPSNPNISNVKIISQPYIDDFVNIFTNILTQLKDTKRDMSIKHIIRFKDNLINKNKLYNLKVLDSLLPLSFFEKLYEVYYSTENFTTDAYEAFFPNFISIDSHTAFTFSEDYESGILYTSKCQESIQLLNEEFNKICNDCLPLFINLESYEKQLLYMYEYEQLVQTDTSLLHPENGFYTFPIELIKEKREAQIISKEYAQILIKRVECFNKRLEKSKALEIISLEGLKNFATTGRLKIYKDIQFSKDERIEILKSLLQFVEYNKNYNLYLMKEENPFYNLDFAIYTIGSELLYIVPSYTNFKITDNIIIRTKGIIESFTDFMSSSFTADNCIIERDKVATVISDIISNI